MSSKRIGLLIVLLALIALSLLFRRPIQTWAATQSCIINARDHYANIENLNGAPDYDSYVAQAEYQCQAAVAYEQFESATTEDARRERGREAITAYSDLIEQADTGWAYLPRRGEIHAELGEVEQALADYSLFRVHAPDSYWILEQRGDLYSQMGRYEEALADYEALYAFAQEDPDSSDAYLARIQQRIDAAEAQQ